LDQLQLGDQQHMFFHRQGEVHRGLRGAQRQVLSLLCMHPLYHCTLVPQVSLWNFVRYNVVGGGDSALYGVEGPAFYLRNGLNNFQLLLPLALLLPLVAAAAAANKSSLGSGSSSSSGKRTGGAGRRDTASSGGGSWVRLLVCVSPLYVWLCAITVLPHKEERFLYVVYPLVRTGECINGESG
jgi:hypothetical protein